MEEFKKKGYYPAGGRSQTSSAGSITYINTDSGLTAGNVQDAIDELASSAGDFVEYTNPDDIFESIPDGNTITALRLAKQGHIITLDFVCSASPTLSPNVWNQLATLKDEFVPSNRFDSFSVNNDTDAAIHTRVNDATSIPANAKQITIWSNTGTTTIIIHQVYAV